MKSKKNIAIVGIGRWGKNLLREFSKISNVRFCHHHGNPRASAWLKLHHPNIAIAASYNQIITDPTIDAMIIATPIKTHYELSRQALLAGKHVFVEKPMTANAKQAQELVRLTKNKKRILFVGHIFSYHPVLAKIKQLTRKEPLRYAGFIWNKLGTFSEKLVFNLLSHDVATALDLFGKPTSIKMLENRGMVTDSDIIYVRLNFKNHRSCTIYINRVSNLKNKTVTLATSKNVYLWENDQLFKLDKRANTLKLIYKSAKTPLEVECREFVRYITQNKKPPTDGKFGLQVVRVLSKIQKYTRS